MTRRTNCRWSSIDALYGATHLGEQERAIVAFLARSGPGDWTRNELAVATGIRISSVSGRINALIERGVVVEGPRRPDRHTHVSSHALWLAPTQAELELVAA